MRDSRGKDSMLHLKYTGNTLERLYCSEEQIIKSTFVREPKFSMRFSSVSAETELSLHKPATEYCILCVPVLTLHALMYRSLNPKPMSRQFR